MGRLLFMTMVFTARSTLAFDHCLAVQCLPGLMVVPGGFNNVTLPVRFLP